MQWQKKKYRRISLEICTNGLNTTDLTGELENRDYVITRGDSRISVQLAKNKHTNVLNRENRFLIDDDDSPHKLAYLLTKPFKRGGVYNGEGTFKFVLQEVTATEYDNHELGIADYYIHFPKDDSPLLDLVTNWGGLIVTDSGIRLSAKQAKKGSGEKETWL